MVWISPWQGIFDNCCEMDHYAFYSSDSTQWEKIFYSSLGLKTQASEKTFFKCSLQNVQDLMSLQGVSKVRSDCKLYFVQSI